MMGNNGINIQLIAWYIIPNLKLYGYTYSQILFIFGGMSKLTQQQHIVHGQEQPFSMAD